MASDNHQSSRSKVIRQLVEEYYNAQPQDQILLREIISKVYAQALRDTDDISDITLKVQFGDLQKIASSGDFESNALAVTGAFVDPIVKPIQEAGDAIKSRSPDLGKEFAFAMTAPVVDLMINPNKNIELVQNAAAGAGHMLENAWEFSARELGFPTDEERKRLAEIYELPYQNRLKALHGETLKDTATMVSIGSAPGLFVNEINAAKVSISAADKTIYVLDQLPATFQKLAPAMISGPTETSIPTFPALMASKASALAPRAQSSGLSSHAAEANENLTLNLSASLQDKLMQVKLPPISVQLENDVTHHIPVTLHIRPEHMIDMTTGQQRDWSGLNKALIPMLTDRTKPENLSHKLNAIKHVEIYFTGDAKFSETYRNGNRRLGDERVSVVVHGHNPTYKNFDHAPMVAAVYPNANIRRPGDIYFNPQMPDQNLTITHGSRHNLPNGLAVLEKELEKLSLMHANLHQLQQSDADEVRLNHLKNRAGLQQQIINSIKESTLDYPDGVKHSLKAPPVLKGEDKPDIKIIEAAETDARTEHIKIDSRGLPIGLLPAGNDLKTIIIGSHDNVPITLTYPAGMDEPDYLKIAVTANGLDLVDPHSRINMISQSALANEVADFVYSHGGTGHGADRSLKPAARESIEAIHLIYLGSRNAKDIDHIGENRYGITVSDDRFLAVAEMKGFDGSPIKPITFKGNLHQPGTYMYDRLAASNQINSETTPFYLTGGRHSAAKIQEALLAEMDTLAKNVQFYNGGDISRVRHEVDFKPPSPNHGQQALNVRRYAELESVLNKFLLIADRYRMVDAVKVGEAAVPANMSQAHDVLGQPGNLSEHAQDIISLKIQENAAKQLVESRQSLDR